jgi:hypothetical protein
MVAKEISDREVNDFLERHVDDMLAEFDLQDRLARMPWTERVVLSALDGTGLPERFIRQEPPTQSRFVKRYQSMIYGVAIPARGR